MKKNKKSVLKNRIVIGEGFIGIDPRDGESIRLFEDFNGYRAVSHNPKFIETINQDRAKYRVVLERVK